MTSIQAISRLLMFTVISVAARVEGDYIREIDSGIKIRFRPESSALATNAWNAIREFCKLP